MKFAEICIKPKNLSSKALKLLDRTILTKANEL